MGILDFLACVLGLIFALIVLLIVYIALGVVGIFIWFALVVLVLSFLRN